MWKGWTRLLVVSGMLLCALPTLAQRVTLKSFTIEINPECIGSENAKAEKALEVMRDRKNEKEKRMEAARKVIELDAECAEAHYYLGLEQLRTAMFNKTSTKAAQNSLAECVRLCPEFHFEPYYFLGYIAWMQGDYPAAVKNFDQYYKLSSASQEPLDEEREDLLKQDYAFCKFFADAYSNPVPFTPVKVPGVSTEDDEYLPLITPDNQSIFVTRKYEIESKVTDGVFKSQETPYVEMFVEAARKGSAFDVGSPLPPPFNVNKNYFYGGASITIDNKHLYLTICTPAPGGYMNCDLFSTDLFYGADKVTGEQGYHWGELKNMGPRINTADGWESQPSISSDGNTLYFATARADSKGIDIYYSTRDAAGNWSQAQSIGAPINTDGNDKTPYMHSDSRTLYFASDGHIGFGGLDVFYTRQNSDGTWSQPVNLGHPINTEGDEQAFVVSTDGRNVYYSAKDPKLSQSIDIWSFELYKEARPDKVVFVSGQVTDESGQVPEDAKVELKAMQSKNVTQVEVDKMDGRFAAVITVREDENVLMQVKGEDLAFQAKLIEPVPDEETAPQLRTDEEAQADYQAIQQIDMKVAEAKAGGVYKINDIYFNSNSAVISEKSKAVLEAFAEYLLAHPEIRIAIHGHTDNVGRDEANLALSTERAFSVKQYLETLGVGGGRIEYKGYGASVPFASNSTEEGRAQNRRTEFLILSQ